MINVVDLHIRLIFRSMSVNVVDLHNDILTVVAEVLAEERQSSTVRSIFRYGKCKIDRRIVVDT